MAILRPHNEKVIKARVLQAENWMGWTLGMNGKSLYFAKKLL